ncbi:ubiquitin-like-specific protease ESD4 [Prunus persica]|uniref:ubiquitin-like-specific protease ESD4 n=1 Tax=Prunus persica TaxID=3760 RepID=UPI0009ABA116|nr:ubiquitin-like-specific protease ESD4 [Prunus persica]
MEGSHNFFVRLLTKDGWLDGSNIDMALLLLRERHESSGNWKCAALDYKQIKAYVGKEDRQHSKGVLGMVKGEGPKLAKSWSSVNCVYLCRTQAIEWAAQLVTKMLPRLLKESRYIGDGLLLKSEWPVIRVMDAPQQVGGGNCGMYILKYYEFLTSNIDLAKISHDVMPFYLLKLVVQLL